jgi:hypothetical protein
MHTLGFNNVQESLFLGKDKIIKSPEHFSTFSSIIVRFRGVLSLLCIAGIKELAKGLSLSGFTTSAPNNLLR